MVHLGAQHASNNWSRYDTGPRVVSDGRETAGPEAFARQRYVTNVSALVVGVGGLCAVSGHTVEFVYRRVHGHGEHHMTPRYEKML